MAVLTFAAGQLVVFAFGVPWLKVATGMSWADAVHHGFLVFLLGGAIKAVMAGLLTPAAWRLVREVDDDR